MDTYKVKLTFLGVVREFTRDYHRSDITFYIGVWTSAGFGVEVEFAG